MQDAKIRGGDMMGKGIGASLVLVVALTTAACTPVYRNHGFIPSEDELSSIIIGVDTRASVEDTFGYPSAEGVSNTRGAYYVSSRWRHFGAMRPRPIEREVLAISYDDQDVVQNVTRYGLEDGEVIVLNRRVTTEANEISFIRQLMGNVGRVNAGDLFGAP